MGWRKKWKVDTKSKWRLSKFIFFSIYYWVIKSWKNGRRGKGKKRNKCRTLKLTRDTHLIQQFIYYYKQLYMFRASICPSSGVLGFVRFILLHMVFSTIKENCALVGCHNVLYVYIAGIRGGCVCVWAVAWALGFVLQVNFNGLAWWGSSLEKLR